MKDNSMETDRMMYICSKKRDFIEKKKWFLNRLIERGYNHYWIRKKLIHPNYENRGKGLKKLNQNRIDKMKRISELL